MIGKLIFSVLLFGFAAFLYNVLEELDLTKRVYNHRPGRCQVVKGPVEGSEDIEYIPSENIAFVTSGLFYLDNRPGGVTGKIFLYDFNDNAKTNEAIEMKIINEPENFHPHGLSSWVADGKITLYVISHTSPDFKHSVVVLDYDKKKRVLTFVKKLEDDKFIRPNDLFAVGPDQIILTNDGYSQSNGLGKLEIILGLKAGSVVYYDGKESKYLISAYKGPNGVWVDLKKNVLFLASHKEENIRIYNTSKGFDSLEVISTVHLLTSVDNLFVDKEGDLWTAAHPVISALLPPDACYSETHPAPSQVLRIRFSDDYKEHEVTEPYTNDGREISCSSTAVHASNRILIGSVAAKLLVCEVSNPEII